MGRIENPDLNDYGASLGWHGTSSNRAKWRSSPSAWSGVRNLVLDSADIVREAILQQLTVGLESLQA